MSSMYREYSQAAPLAPSAPAGPSDRADRADRAGRAGPPTDTIYSVDNASGGIPHRKSFSETGDPPSPPKHTGTQSKLGQIAGYTFEQVYEQGSGALNEDAILVQASNDSGLAAVFDGASSLSGERIGGYTGAWWAANLARQAFAANNAPLDTLALRANSSIASTMAQCGIHCGEYESSVIISDMESSCEQETGNADAQGSLQHIRQDVRQNIRQHVQQRLRLWSASAAAVRFPQNKAQAEFTQIGDALIVCIDHSGSWSLPAAYHNHDYETLRQWKHLAESGVTDIRTRLSHQIAGVRLQMNRTFGVMNGEAEMARFLQSGTFSLENTAHVLLFTDGLHIPCSNPDDRGCFDTLVECYLTEGLSGVHRTVRRMEEQDPCCRRYPRFKQHDDIAAIAISF